MREDDLTESEQALEMQVAVRKQPNYPEHRRQLESNAGKS